MRGALVSLAFVLGSLMARPLFAQQEPTECSAEQLRSLATSTFFERTEELCGTYRQLERHGRLDAADATGSRWRAFTSFCDGSGGVGGACSLTDRGRDLLLEGWETYVRGVARRTELALALCPELARARTGAAAAPAARASEVSAAIGAVEAFCATPESGIAPAEASLAQVQVAVRVGRDPQAAQTGPTTSAELWERASAAPADSGSFELPEGGGGPLGQAPAAMPSVGAFDLALHGLASLLASRGRAELEAAAVDRLQELMCVDEARPWFRHTCAFLGGQSGAPSAGAPSERSSSGVEQLRRQAPSSSGVEWAEAGTQVRLGTGLRTAFGRDILELPRRALATAPEVGSPAALRFRLFFETIDALAESTDPRDVADRVAAVGARWACGRTRGYGRRCREARAAVTRAGLVILALSSRGRVGSLSETTAFGIVESMSGGTLDDEGRRSVRRLVAQLRSLDRTALRIAATTTEEQRLSQIVPLARSTVAALNLALRCAADARGGRVLELPPGIPEIMDAMARRQLTDLMVSTTAALGDLDRDALAPRVVRALAVGAELADAETDEDAEAAIAALAAPAGSWRLKRSRFLVSVGGLIGLDAATEWMTGPALSETPTTGSASLLGAIGLDVNFPFGSSTLGVFVSALDIGALLSVPLGEVDEAGLTTGGEARRSRVRVTRPVRIAQILSPGLYLRWGLPSLPLVLGAGASVVPSGRHLEELRSDGEAVSADLDVIRLMGLLALDVTLFSL